MAKPSGACSTIVFELFLFLQCCNTFSKHFSFTEVEDLLVSLNPMFLTYRILPHIKYNLIFVFFYIIL